MKEYLLVQALVNLFFFLIWEKNTFLNLAIKVVLAILTIASGVLYLQQAGYIVRFN